MSPQPITFRAEDHTYWLDTTRVPSVTEILVDAGIIRPEFYTEDARTLGEFVHLATALDDRGKLNEKDLDPAIRPYLEAWRRFKKETRVTAIHEVEHVVHKGSQWAGTLDRTLTFSSKAKPQLLDIKTGEPEKWHRLQLAGYGAAYGNTRPMMDVYLKGDGSYKVSEIREFAYDETVFVSLVNVWHWKERNGFHGKKG